jgi:hypothetical protein
VKLEHQPTHKPHAREQRRVAWEELTTTTRSAA